MKKYPTRFKIGVMGSAGRGRKLPEKLLLQAREVGKEIARAGCILITGACMGVPHEAARGTSNENGTIIGFSPASSLKEHLKPPISYPRPFKNCILIFTGLGKEGRNLISIRNCDAVIFLAGSAGTLVEFSLAYHMGKVIGVLEGTGGITEKIPKLAKSIKKRTGAIIISVSYPKKLVEKIIKQLSEKTKDL